jgi:hypothetical protein
MLSNKVPLPIVSSRLGHANPAITLAIYSHVMRTDDQAAASALDAGLGARIPAPKALQPTLVTRSDIGTREEEENRIKKIRRKQIGSSGRIRTY